MLPKITVVIPSFNQGCYIEQTIQSIVSQNYPRLELLVMDGGSSDNTVEILEKYDSQLTYWRSAPDRGQAAAINEGFSIATGDLVAWQNSDDYYYPNAFSLVSEAFQKFKNASVFYGDKDYVDHTGKFLKHAPSRDPHESENMIPWPCIHSEVAFFRRSIFANGLRLNESRKHYMDYELFWDLLIAGEKFLHVPGVGAGFRQHPDAKTSKQGAIAQKEAFEIYEKVYRSGFGSSHVNRELINAMRYECLNDYGNLRLELLGEHSKRLAELGGSGAVGKELWLKLLISRLGPRSVKAAQRVRELLGKALRHSAAT
jgi:glycosyltransferase involved in cell wall biosynthesis